MVNYSQDIPLGQHPVKKRRSGILKGTFVLPLPDDFDEKEKAMLLIVIKSYVRLFRAI